MGGGGGENPIKNRLRVFLNRMLRIFRPKTDEVMGGWRKLHEARYNLYSSPSIISIGRACSMNGEKMNAFRILM
jgi:hypothetical protein